MSDISSAKIKPPLHLKMSLVFDLLRDQLAQNNLLGKVLAPDNDSRAMIAS
jgi:hypothetical protein